MPAKARAAKSNAAIAVIGIDIGKNVFHLIGLDQRGAIVFKTRLSRGQLESRLANIRPCLIGMEACVGARPHRLGRSCQGAQFRGREERRGAITVIAPERPLLQTARTGSVQVKGTAAEYGSLLPMQQLRERGRPR